MNQQSHLVYLGLGTNLGDRATQLRNAIKELGEIGSVQEVSRVYETPSWGYDDNRKYLNAVCMMKTSLSIVDLHEITLSIESNLGRIKAKRKEGDPYTAREIDIDILFYDDQIIETEELVVPHPRLHLRNFVLKPLLDLSVTPIHPKLNKSITQLLSELGEASEIAVLEKWNIVT